MTRHILTLFLLLSAAAYSQDTVYYINVHFIYGSKPSEKSEFQSKWFGGKLGGHVGLEISPDKVIHFNPGGKVRAFGRKGETGNYRDSEVEEFDCTFTCDSVKKLIVRIPINAGQKSHLDSIAIHYLHKAPYPYAFFGMRCTAAAFHLLTWAEVFKKKSKFRMLMRYFYPRLLRKKLLREARKNGWQVTKTEGIVARKWDHD